MLKKLILAVVVIAILAAAFFYMSSGGKEKAKQAIAAQRVRYAVLVDSAHMASDESDSILNGMSELMIKPESAQKMQFIFPKAQMMKLLTNEAVIFIDQTKVRFLAASTSRDDSVDKSAVKNVMMYEGAGNELFGQLVKYSETFLRIDPGVDKQFHDDLLTFKEINLHDSTTWVAARFKDQTILGALIVLQKLEANLRMDELRGIEFERDGVAIDKVEYGDHKR